MTCNMLYKSIKNLLVSRWNVVINKHPAEYNMNNGKYRQAQWTFIASDFTTRCRYRNVYIISLSFLPSVSTWRTIVLTSASWTSIPSDIIVCATSSTVICPSPSLSNSENASHNPRSASQHPSHQRFTVLFLADSQSMTDSFAPV